MKKDEKLKNYSSQKIKCDVKDCAHNYNKDCICELESIKVCTCTDDDSAQTHENTACKSYDCKCK